MRAVSYIYMIIILLLLLISSFYVAINIFHLNFFTLKYTDKMDCRQFQGFVHEVMNSCNNYGTCFYGYINLTESCLGFKPGYYFVKIDMLPSGGRFNLIRIK